MQKLQPIIVLLCLISGCATNTSIGTPLDVSFVNTIEEGVTTESEIKNALGSPLSVSISPDGSKLLVYSYTTASANAWLSPGKVQTNSQTLQVWVNKAGVVLTSSFNESDRDINSY